MYGFFVGGLFAQALGNVLALVAVTTGLLTVMVRSIAALRADKHLSGEQFNRRLERATARGFFFGLLASGVALLIDAVIGK